MNCLGNRMKGNKQIWVLLVLCLCGMHRPVILRAQSALNPDAGRNVIGKSTYFLGAKYAFATSGIYMYPQQDAAFVMNPINFGLVFKHFSEKYMGTHVELIYGTKGYRFVDTSGVQLERMSHVLELPVMAEARIPIGSRFHLMVTGGGFLSYYLQNKETKDPGGLNQVRYFDYERFHGIEYGITAGLGLSYRLGAASLFLDGRYMMSLSYLYKPTIELYESDTQQVSVSAGIFFNLNEIFASPTKQSPGKPAKY